MRNKKTRISKRVTLFQRLSCSVYGMRRVPPRRSLWTRRVSISAIEVLETRLNLSATGMEAFFGSLQEQELPDDFEEINSGEIDDSEETGFGRRGLEFESSGKSSFRTDQFNPEFEFEIGIEDTSTNADSFSDLFFDSELDAKVEDFHEFEPVQFNDFSFGDDFSADASYETFIDDTDFMTSSNESGHGKGSGHGNSNDFESLSNGEFITDLFAESQENSFDQDFDFTDFSSVVGEPDRSTEDFLADDFVDSGFYETDFQLDLAEDLSSFDLSDMDLSEDHHSTESDLDQYVANLSGNLFSSDVSPLFYDEPVYSGGLYNLDLSFDEDITVVDFDDVTYDNQPVQVFQSNISFDDLFLTDASNDLHNEESIDVANTGFDDFDFDDAGVTVEPTFAELGEFPTPLIDSQVGTESSLNDLDLLSVNDTSLSLSDDLLGSDIVIDEAFFAESRLSNGFSGSDLPVSSAVASAETGVSDFADLFALFGGLDTSESGAKLTRDSGFEFQSISPELRSLLNSIFSGIIADAAVGGANRVDNAVDADGELLSAVSPEFAGLLADLEIDPISFSGLMSGEDAVLAETTATLDGVTDGVGNIAEGGDSQAGNEQESLDKLFINMTSQGKSNSGQHIDLQYGNGDEFLMSDNASGQDFREEISPGEDFATNWQAATSILGSSLVLGGFTYRFAARSRMIATFRSIVRRLLS